MIKRLLAWLRGFKDPADQHEASPIAPEIAPPSPPPPGQVHTIESRRSQDLSAEAQLAIYMDKYLYDRFPTKESFSCIRRVYTKKEQLDGIDVQLIAKDGSVYNIDEKAQLYYLNQNIPTFAFELSFLRNGKESIGWLCNSSLKTDFYLLIWPFATQDTCKNITWNQFLRVECLLIQKQKLLRKLSEFGLTPEKMQEDAKILRRRGKPGKAPIAGLHGVYYYLSDSAKYREAPINIIVSKRILSEIAQRKYIVSSDGVTVE